MNRRSPRLARLLHRLRDFVTIDQGNGVSRRDLESPDQCEVQLELDFGRRGTPKAFRAPNVEKYRVEP